MRIKDCAKCEKCERRVWSDYHVPKNYHPIGMSHAYAWCAKYKKRVSQIKKCERIQYERKQKAEISDG